LDGYPVTILLSQGLGSDGKKEGDEQLLFPIPSGAGPFDVWFPFPGRLLATPDGYLLASPRFKTLDFAIQSNVRVSIADLDTSGAVTGDLADVAQVPVGTVRTLDASAWPSSQSILAWQEGPKAAEGSLDPGGRVRVLIRAKAP
jgi:hypothetical protein